MSESELIEVTCRVDVAPTEAYEIFTGEVDLWWKRGPRFRTGMTGGSTLRFEPFAGGRFLETQESGEILEFGRVLTWDPPRRLIFTLGGRDFGADERPEVEVSFDPDGDGTRVSIEQRGFERLAPDHPARYGARGNALRGLMGHWWSDLLVSLQQRVSSRR